MFWELVGHTGGFLIAVSLTPQLIKTYKTKKAEDISLLWTAILLAGLLLYIVYAIKRRVVPLIVFGTVEALMATTLIGFKIRYDRQEESQSDKNEE
jgi:MtN3 and saliva related transmembrane protein